MHVNHKEKVICKFDKDFKKSFSWPSNPSNDNIIPAYAWSEDGYRS